MFSVSVGAQLLGTSDIVGSQNYVSGWLNSLHLKEFSEGIVDDDLNLQLA